MAPQIVAGEITWRWLTFDQLTTDELYRIMRLRQQVFVVEQNCVYLDADGHDPLAIHGLGEIGIDLVAYARVVPANVTYDTPSIGRVVTAPGSRGSGFGRLVTEQAISEATRRFPGQPVTIGAQLYLQSFYESLGFVAVGEPYEEDGIAHVDMERGRRP